jgi:hypothetical protein
VCVRAGSLSSPAANRDGGLSGTDLATRPCNRV